MDAAPEAAAEQAQRHKGGGSSWWTGRRSGSELPFGGAAADGSAFSAIAKEIPLRRVGTARAWDP